MIPRDRDQKPFDLILYGRSASELLTVPNEVIGSLARRYPDYTSSPFLIYDFVRN